MYLVTVEGTDDGMWFGDPEGFDSESEARKFAAEQKPPAGNIVALYRCHLVEILGEV
jgi:hypothetical protein